MIDILPASLHAGLTFDRVVTRTAYPADDGWVLSAVLRGPAAIDLTATAEGSQHRFRALADITAGWAPGRYAYTVRATRGGDVQEVESGAVAIHADLSAVGAGHDPRTHAEKVLDAINAVLEKRATQDQEKYRINNRELWRTPIADLLVLRDRYRAEVQNEQRVRRGQPLFGRAVRVRF